MPVYEYSCTKCGKTTEVFQKVSDPEPTECEHCGAAGITKVFHPAGIVFKGSGFYATDYGHKQKSAPAETSPAEKKGPETTKKAKDDEKDP